MFEWINKPEYLWVFKDKICCVVEVTLVVFIIYALLVWWTSRK